MKHKTIPIPVEPRQQTQEISSGEHYCGWMKRMPWFQ